MTDSTDTDLDQQAVAGQVTPPQAGHGGGVETIEIAVAQHAAFGQALQGNADGAMQAEAERG